jgi:hypothetical protein
MEHDDNAGQRQVTPTSTLGRIANHVLDANRVGHVALVIICANMICCGLDRTAKLPGFSKAHYDDICSCVIADMSRL